MEPHEFEITIQPNGQVRIHIKGLKGPKCLEEAQVFEEILGKITEVRQTTEFYETPTEVTVQIRDQGQAGS